MVSFVIITFMPIFTTVVDFGFDCFYIKTHTENWQGKGQARILACLFSICMNGTNHLTK